MNNSESLLKKHKISNGILHLEVECPSFRSDWSGFIFSYLYKTEKDMEEHFFPAQKYVTDKSVILVADIKLEDAYLRQTHWEILAVCGEDGQAYKSSISGTKIESKRALVRKINNICDFLKKDYCRIGDNIAFIVTGNHYVRLRYRPMTRHDEMSTRWKEMRAVLSYNMNPSKYEKQNIWLIYEKKCMNAQDNGYYLFKYCMENNIETKLNRKIYYVIDKSSTSYEKVAMYKDNVLDFMSMEHLKAILGCRLLLSSDSRDHGYIWQYNKSMVQSYFAKKRFVFLGHGVLAIKKLNNNFFAHNQNAIMTTATSDAEAEVFVDELNYPAVCAPVTGYARFDALKDESENYNEILVMPTHRPELYQIEESIFIESDYYKRYMALLNDESLHRSLEEHDITLNFYLHPSICEHTDTFSSSSDRVRIIHYGEIPLDTLMMRCKLLLTDYSSISWDVFYMGKPMIFYQYDLEEYTKGWDSYIDLKTEMPGERVETHEEAVNALLDYINNGFEMKPFYEKMRNDRFEYFDDNNSYRIVEELKKRKL